MSTEAMAIALHHSRAKGTTRLVLLGIANHDSDGGAWPSIATLSIYAGGVVERSVQRSLRELEALGEIEVVAQQGGTRDTRDDRRPNLYRFLLECPPDCDHTKNHRRRGSQVRPSGRGDAGVTPPAPRGDAGVAHGVTPTSPEPSLEPSTNSGGVPSGTRATLGAPSENLRNDNDQERPQADLGGRPSAHLLNPTRCLRHQDDLAPPPCGACREAREADENHRRRQHAQAEAARRADEAAEREHKRRVIAACGMCDGNGWLVAAGRPCTHDPDRAERNRRGRAAVEAAREAARLQREQVAAIRAQHAGEGEASA